MKGLREKFRKNSGFTLVEMLIVVAIIAILVAVSIPTVAGALEKAREATDTANERSAVGAAEMKYLSDFDGIAWSGTADARTATFKYSVDGASGSLRAADDTSGKYEYGQCKTHAKGYIEVTLKVDGTVTLAWKGGTGSTVTGTPHFAATTAP